MIAQILQNKVGCNLDFIRLNIDNSKKHQLYLKMKEILINTKHLIVNENIVIS